MIAMLFLLSGMLVLMLQLMLTDLLILVRETRLEMACFSHPTKIYPDWVYPDWIHPNEQPQ